VIVHAILGAASSAREVVPAARAVALAARAVALVAPAGAYVSLKAAYEFRGTASTDHSVTIGSMVPRAAPPMEPVAHMVVA
jgi:hypothetical protein